MVERRVNYVDSCGKILAAETSRAICGRLSKYLQIASSFFLTTLAVALWEKYVIFIEEQASAARKSEDLESQRIFDEKLLTDVYHQALEATRFHMTEAIFLILKVDYILNGAE